MTTPLSAGRGLKRVSDQRYRSLRGRGFCGYMEGESKRQRMGVNFLLSAERCGPQSGSADETGTHAHDNQNALPSQVLDEVTDDFGIFAMQEGVDSDLKGVNGFHATPRTVIAGATGELEIECRFIPESGSGPGCELGTMAASECSAGGYGGSNTDDVMRMMLGGSNARIEMGGTGADGLVMALDGDGESLGIPLELGGSGIGMTGMGGLGMNGLGIGMGIGVPLPLQLEMGIGMGIGLGLATNVEPPMSIGVGLQVGTRMTSTPQTLPPLLSSLTATPLTTMNSAAISHFVSTESSRYPTENEATSRLGRKSAADYNATGAHRAAASANAAAGPANKKKGYACGVCGFVFGMKSNLTRHVSTVHLSRRAWTCGTCGASFGLKQNLETHVRARHERRRPFACCECGLAFGYKQVLQNHVRHIHGKGD
jgi:Zinc finger, C2H2 type